MMIENLQIRMKTCKSYDDFLMFDQTNRISLVSMGRGPAFWFVPSIVKGQEAIDPVIAPCSPIQPQRNAGECWIDQHPNRCKQILTLLCALCTSGLMSQCLIVVQNGAEYKNGEFCLMIRAGCQDQVSPVSDAGSQDVWSDKGSKYPPV
jgi:hypothetical protein